MIIINLLANYCSSCERQCYQQEGEYKIHLCIIIEPELFVQIEHTLCVKRNVT